jgi:phosphatidylglycerophosphate synthase
MNYSLDEIRVAAKRESFRAGPRMRFVMPQLSVRVTRWILNRDLHVTPNQITVVSAVLGLAAGLLLIPTGVMPAVAAFLVYHAHILTDYVDGEIARIKQLSSTNGAFYDLMVGRATKPIVLYSAAVGSWLAHRDAAGAELDLLFGALIVFGFFLDKEAVDVWYRANPGRVDIEDQYVVRSERALKGPRRLVVRVMVGLTSIVAFLVYQIAAAVAMSLDVKTLWVVWSYDVTPRSLILVVYAVAFPALAVLRSLYIARTGHIPRRQDLVPDD